MNLNQILIAGVACLTLNMPLMAGFPEVEAVIAAAKKEIPGITAQDLKKQIDKEAGVWMLDIREPYMRPEGEIEGDENVAIARGLLEMNVRQAIKDKNTFVVVYCRSGKGAVLAAKMLKNDLGYKHVTYLTGGLDGWLKEGYSIWNDLGELKRP